MTPDSYHFLFGVLLTAQVLICIAMGALILIQRSEGGALGMGGGPSGFMSARGTGNLLTSLTSWFGIAFFVCSIALTFVGNRASHTGSVLDQADVSKLTLTPPATTGQQPAADATGSSAAPSLANLPLAGTAPASQAPAPVVVAPAKSAPSSRAASSQLTLPSLSSSASSSSPTADQVAKAKASVFRSASSSAAPATSSATPSTSSSSAPQ